MATDKTDIWNTDELDASADEELLAVSAWVDSPESEPQAEELGAWVDAAKRDSLRARLPWAVRKDDAEFHAIVAHRKRFELAIGADPDRSEADLERLWRESAGQ